MSINRDPKTSTSNCQCNVRFQGLSHAWVNNIHSCCQRIQRWIPGIGSVLRGYRLLPSSQSLRSSSTLRAINQATAINSSTFTTLTRTSSSSCQLLSIGSLLSAFFPSLSVLRLFGIPGRVSLHESIVRVISIVYRLFESPSPLFYRQSLVRVSLYDFLLSVSFPLSIALRVIFSSSLSFRWQSQHQRHRLQYYRACQRPLRVLHIIQPRSLKSEAAKGH